jgi:hypothetical protein
MPSVAGESENEDEMFESAATCHTPQPSTHHTPPFPTPPGCSPVFVFEERTNKDVLDQFSISNIKVMFCMYKTYVVLQVKCFHPYITPYFTPACRSVVRVMLPK